MQPATVEAPVPSHSPEAVRLRRQKQLRDRISEAKPDLALAIRNARGQNLSLSLLHAQMLLAEVLLTQGNAKGALLLLRPGT